MEFFNVKRNILFKNKYRYKAHFNILVHWDGKRETWNNKSDKDYMMNVIEILKDRFPGKYCHQGSVVYTNDLDCIFWIRLLFDEKLMKIEKVIDSEE